MAAFFLLLALIGGALVGDLVWENTATGELTVLDRLVTGYPQGWLLAAAAATGFVTALLLVASVGSTRGRRERRRQLRSMKRHRQEQAFEPEPGAPWLAESFQGRETAADTGEPLQRPAEPLYEQTRRNHLQDDRRQQ